MFNNIINIINNIIFLLLINLKKITTIVKKPIDFI